MPTNTPMYMPEPRGDERGRAFWRQAAQFSALAPIVAVVLIACCRSISRIDPSIWAGGPLLVLIVGGLAILLVACGLVLGIVGLIGGIRRAARGMVALAAVGILLNGLLAYLLFPVFSFVLTLSLRKPPAIKPVSKTEIVLCYK